MRIKYGLLVCSVIVHFSIVQANDEPLVTRKKDKRITNHQTGLVVAEDAVLGDGRFIMIERNIMYKGDVPEVEGSSLCCQECKKKYADSNMFNFEKVWKRCYCYKSIPEKGPRTAPGLEWFADVCGANNKVGDGLVFDGKTVVHVGKVRNVEQHSDCCRLCNNESQITQMYHYSHKQCFCKMSMPGIQSEIKIDKRYTSGYCGDGLVFDGNTVVHVGNVRNVEQHSDCCRLCNNESQITQMYHYSHKQCFCKMSKPGIQFEIKIDKRYKSGYCAETERMKPWNLTINATVTPNLQVEVYKSLETGLTVAIGKADSPVVSGFFCLATETFNDEGLPHTLEHLVFVGSKKYPYKGVLDLLANRCFADRTNAWTASDHTCYTVRTAGSDGFLNILPVFMDHILRPTLNDSDYQTEVYRISVEGKDVGVVYSEMQGIESTPERILLRKTLELLYPDTSGYRRETGGVLESIRSKTNNERVKEYHKKYYRPENLFLTITGKVEAQQIFDALNTVEQTWKNENPDPPEFEKAWQNRTDVQPGNETIYQYASSDETSGYVIVAWRRQSSITENVEDFLAQKYLLDFLTLPEIGPLDKAMVSTEEPLATSIKVEQENFREAVFILTFTNVPMANISDVDKEMERIINQMVEDKENVFKENYLPMIHSVIDQDLLQTKKDEENTPQTFVPQITSIFQLYGETENDFRNLIKKELRRTNLKEKQSTFWIEALKQTLINSPKVVLRGEPSIELLSNKTHMEISRIRDRNETLNFTKLKLEEETAIANQARPPTAVLKKIPLADVNDIKFRQVEIINSSNIECENFPFEIKIINVTTSFVQLYMFMDTTKLTLRQKKMLPLLLDVWTYSQVFKDGSIIPQNKVLQDRDINVLGFYAGFGFYDQYNEAIVFEAQCQLDNLDLAIENIQNTLLFADPTEEDVEISIENKLYSIPEMKQSVTDVQYAMYDRLVYQNNTNLYLKTFFEQEPFLNDLIDNITSTTSEIKDIMSILTDSKNVFVYIATNADKLLEDQRDSFKKISTLFNKTTNDDIQIEIKHDYDLKLTVEENHRHIAIGMPDTESCYLKQSVNYTKENVEDIKVAQMEVLLRYLSDRMYDKVRGRGLAYGIDLSLFISSGDISLDLSRSPHIVDAVKEIKAIFDLYAKNESAWDTHLLDSAKGSLIYEKTQKEETVEDMILEVSKALIRSNNIYYNRNLIKKLADVSVDDISLLAKKFLLKFFDKSNSITILACNSATLDEVVKELEMLTGFQFKKYATVDEFGQQLKH